MHEEHELLDLFDINENIVGTIERAEYYENLSQYKDVYLRSAELFIVNDKGQLWVPVRAKDKKIAPGGLDYSAGGHVGSGETYKVGLLREAEEELGLILREGDLRLVASFTPLGGNNWFRRLFLYRSNEVPKYNKEDFSSYKWMLPSELLRALHSGVTAKASMLETVEYVVGHNLI